jgi:pantoate--beta-alanine ligase
MLTNYNLGFLETVLEGEFRPGHFQGVCQVVHRLLEIVLPTKLYLGQKDYQQCMVIKKLLELVKMDEVIKIIVVQTMRESDGLAMSSRNKRLDQNSRKKATAISKALYFVKENIKAGNPDEILQSAKSQLQSSGFTIDYLQLAYTDSLKPVTSWDGKQKVVVLVAAFLEGVRLIDNMMID